MARPDDLPSWRWTSARHPRLTLRLDAGPGEVLAEVTSQLRRQGFRIRDATASGCRATHLDWWGLVGSPFEWDRTVLEVVVRPEAGGTAMTLRVASGRYGPAGRKRTVRALRGTVEAGAGRGWQVTWDDWTGEEGGPGPDRRP